ncbi:hypothetical protein AB0F15_15650 [Amycolatopsis sp. NPDC026612]
MTLDAEPEGRLYIDGKFREAAGGERFEVVNPADESLQAKTIATPA